MKVSGAVIIAFCLSLVSFVMLENRHPDEGKGEGATEAPDNEEKSIISDSLFPLVEKAPAAKLPSSNLPELASPLPKPGSPLRLLALFQTYDQARASAVVLHPEIGAYRYHVGDQIDRTRVLAAILPDRILVREGESMEVFHLEPLSAASAALPESEDERAVLSVPLSEAEQKKQNILKHFDLYPVSDSMPSGYIVGDKFPEDAAKNTGVRPGDVLVSVNGYPVGEDNSDYLAWISFQTTQKASIVISRDGEEFVIYYPEDILGAQRQGG
ncbi:hypothetical protein A167_03130 [Alcanivorax sp. S71-1-4]|uniref:type II secretion system protein N n=1 Tax=Alcanivorax sp. S71-1-4 TaxID=1177159 RepID=UPI00135A07FC|nr:type II secretion system protein N [Alcanivorax sp. S71-1-4]KAF0806801.1 hypothetical protein A167_03130 [Alcanivorax sp. S71-1-4]